MSFKACRKLRPLAAITKTQIKNKRLVRLKLGIRANVFMTKAAPKLIKPIITIPHGKTFGLSGFLKVKAITPEAMDRTRVLESSTKLKSTSLKKSITRNVDVPNKVMNVTRRSESKLEGRTNSLYANSCSFGNLQMKEYREKNCKFAGLLA